MRYRMTGRDGDERGGTKGGARQVLWRLRVDRRWSGQRLGAVLLADVLRRACRASEALAVYAVIVDAKDERARAFYEHFGFAALPGSARRLLLPMSALEHLFDPRVD